jgi:hypothetical protein
MSENQSGGIIEMVKLDRRVIPAEFSKVNCQLVELNGISISLMAFYRDCGETLHGRLERHTKEENEGIARILDELDQLVCRTLTTQETSLQMSDVLQCMNDKLEELDWKISREAEEMDKKMIESLKEKIGQLKERLEEVLNQLINDGQKEMLTKQEDKEEIVDKGIKGEVRDVGTRINGKEIGNLVVDLANGTERRGKLEEMDVPVANRRIGKTKNPNADMLSILANARAIPEPDVDICFLSRASDETGERSNC